MKQLSEAQASPVAKSINYKAHCMCGCKAVNDYHLFTDAINHINTHESSPIKLISTNNNKIIYKNKAYREWETREHSINC